MTAGNIMTREVCWIREDQTAGDVVAAIDRCGHAAYPVVDKDMKVLGMIAEDDLIHLALPDYMEGLDLSFLPASAMFFPNPKYGDDLSRVPVQGIMRTTHVVTAEEDEPVAELARLMLHYRIGRIPVLRDGKLVGIVSRSDIVHAIVRPALSGPRREGGDATQSGSD